MPSAVSRLSLGITFALFAAAGAVFGFLSCPFSPVSKFMEGFLP